MTTAETQQLRRLRLTAAQTSVWVAQQAEPESSLYQCGTSYEITGDLDVDSVEHAIAGALRETDGLRARFVTDGDDVLQFIEPADGIEPGFGRATVDVVDLRDATDPVAEAHEWMERDLRSAPDLGGASLVRHVLIRTGTRDSILFLRYHHIVLDGFGQMLYVRRIGELYSALVTAEPRPRARARALTDLVTGDAEYNDSQRYLDDRRFWLDEYSDVPEPHSISGRAAAPGPRPFVQSVPLSGAATLPESWRAGRWSAVIVAAAAAFVHRMTGTEDVVVGLPMLARTGSAALQTPTMLANEIPLRVRVTPDGTFEELVAQVQRAVRKALGAQQFRGEELHRLVGLAGTAGRLGSLSVNAMSFAKEPEFAGTTVRGTVLSTGPVADLALTAVRSPGEPVPTLMFQANSRLYDAVELAEHAGRFGRFLGDLLNDHTQRVSESVLLSAEEQQRITQWETGKQTCESGVDRWLRRIGELARTQPNATAVSATDGTISYAELDRRAHALAAVLRSRGIGPESFVAVALSRRTDLVVALLAVLRAGGAYLPIDTTFPADRIAYMVEDCNPAVILVDSHSIGAVPAVGPKPIDVTDLPEVADPASHEADVEHEEVSALNAAYIIYTSGSTGRPKGVVVTREGLDNFVDAMLEVVGLTPHDRLLAVTTVSFDISCLELYVSLTAGAHVVLADETLARSPAELVETVRAERVTLLQATPGLWASILDTDSSALAEVRALVGGEALDPTLAQRMRVSCADVVNLYGPTETTVWSSTADVRSTRTPDIGTPIRNTQIYVLDKRLRPVPPGVSGEIYVSGTGLARGYSNRPGLTSERFVPDLISDSPGARMYRTGDVGRWSREGRLQCEGRADHQVKVRGYRIELGEVEAVLAAYPDVARAAAIVREDQPGDRRIVGYVVPRPPGDVDLDDLLSSVAETLPRYMIPSELVVLEALPSTPNGKVDRRALPAPRRREASARGPRDAAESMLCEVVADVLGMERVGIDDDFFALGGHSLLATQVIGRLARRGVRLQTQHLYAAPTVAQMARHIESMAEFRASALAPLNSSETERLLADSGAAHVWPVTPLQQGLLFHAGADDDAYLVQLELDLAGPVSVDAVRDALGAVVGRHPLLRASFTTADDGTVVQLIHDRITVPVSETDLTDPSSHPDPYSAARDLAQSDGARRIDPEAVPLLRAALYRLSTDVTRVTISVHHLVIDGWSLPILTRDFLAALAGRSLPPLRSPADYLGWLAGQDPRTSLTQWHKALSGVEPTLLGSGRVGVVAPTTMQVDLVAGMAGDANAERLARGIERLARQTGVTESTVVEAAWGLTLARILDRTDVVFGTTVSVRPPELPGVEDLIGLFINTVPLRITTGNADFRVRDLLADRLRRRTETVSEEHVGLATLQKDLGHPDLFDTLLLHETLPIELDSARADAHDAGVQLLGADARDGTHYPIVVRTTPGRTWSCRIQYRPDIVEEHTVTTLGRAFAHILRQMVDGPEARVGSIGALTPVELDIVVRQWNDTRRPVPEPGWMDRFEAWARNHRSAEAVVAQDTRLTYGELIDGVDRLTAQLGKREIGPGRTVAVALPRTSDLVIALLSVLRSGAAYLPIDSSYPADRIEYMLLDAEPSLILTAADSAAALPDTTVPRLSVTDLDSNGSDVVCDHTARPCVPGDAPAYVIYTSGSTGRPKGVVIGRQALENFLAGMAELVPVEATSRVLGVTTVGFDIAGLELFLPLRAGATLVLADRDTVREPAELCALIAAEHITVAQATPSLWQAVVDERPDVLAGVSILVGGEALPQDLADRLVANAASVTNMYGPTESTIWSTTSQIASDRRPDIGRPILNTSTYVLDRELRPVPIGTAGELYVGGAGLAHGYLGRPALTAERFVANPYETGTRLYRTGDVTRLDEAGTIHYLGRADTQVKLHGFRIELGEVEAALRRHVDVRGVAVVVRKDPTGGDRLIAYVEAQLGREVVPSELRSDAHRWLPPYMVPSAVVVLDALPLTPNGKVDRKALPAVGPVPREVTRVAATETEKALCAAFGEVLGHSDIGADDDFFALGGDSVTSFRLIGAARAKGIELSVRTIFALRTPGALAHAVRTAETEGSQAPVEYELDRVLPDEQYDRIMGEPGIEAVEPLAGLQPGIYFHSAFDEEAEDVYTVQLLIEVDGPLDLDRLRWATDRIVERHSVFRTGFRRSGLERPVAVISASATVDIETHHAGSPADREALLAEHRTRRFDLTAPPLLRVLAIECESLRWTVAVTAHHLVVDGWSLPIVVTELLEGYAAERDTVETNTRTPSYSSFVRWLAGPSGRRHSGPEALDSLARSLDDVDPTRLCPDIDLVASDPARLSRRLTGDRTVQLERFAAERSVTLNTLIQAAWAVTLGAVTGSRRVQFGVTMAGRPDDLPDAESIVGLLINTLPLAVDLRPDDTVSALLARVRDEQARLLSFSHVSLAELQSTLGKGSLFDTSVIFENFPVDLAAVDRLARSAGLSLRSADVADASHFAVGLMAVPGVELELKLHYQPTAFESTDIDRIADRLIHILIGLVESESSATVASLDPLLPKERSAALAAGTGPLIDPADTLLPELLTARFRTAGDQLAVISGGRSLTYRELDTRSGALAAELQRREIGIDDIVAVGLPRSVDLVVALVAVLRSGAAYLPLDTEYPVDRIALMLELAAPSALIDGFDDSVPFSGPRIRQHELESVITAGARAEDVHIHPSSLAYTIFTSGSTGVPKAVGVSHAAISAYMSQNTRAFGSMMDTSLVPTSIGFDLTVTALFTPLTLGGSVRLEALDSLLGDYTPEFLKATPSHLPLIEQLTTVRPRKALILGGEPLHADTVRRWRNNNPDAALINSYGPSETTVSTLVHVVPPGELITGPLPIGRPVEGMRAYVLDSALRPVPANVPGELYLAGLQVARGYLRHPALTAHRFVPDPFGDPGERMYRTGDVAARTTDGSFSHLGRTDDQVKVRGHRIEPGEVAAVLRGMVDVADAAAVVRTDLGSRAALVGYVVAEHGATLDPQQLIARTADRLPIAWVPSAIVVLPALPVTPNGKLDRAALPAPPEQATTTRTAPRTAVEEILCRLTAELLGLPEVGVEDDFFGLGGDSITSLQLVGRARGENVVFSARQVFQCRTISRLARVTTSTAVAVSDCAVAPTGIVRRTPIMRALLERGPKASDKYNQTVVSTVPATGDPRRAAVVLQALLDRHDALRMRSHDSGALEIAQRDHVDVDELVRRVPSLHGPANMSDAALQEIARDAVDGLDLRAGRAVQAVWLDGGPATDGRLLLAVHHLCVDGVSWRILLDDVRAAWDALERGETTALAKVGTSFREWSDRLADRRPASSDRWLGVLEDAPPRRLDPRIDTNADAVRTELRMNGTDVAALLGAVPQQLRAGIDEVVLAAFGVATGRAVVTVEKHGRAEELFPGVDLSRTVGWFTTAFPVRVGVGAGSDATEQQLLVEVLDTAKVALRTVADQGIDYGAARYADAERFADVGSARYALNYLGRSGGRAEAQPLDVPNPDVGLAHEIELNAFVDDRVDGPELVAVWTHAPRLVSSGEVHALAHRFFDALRLLVRLGSSDGHVRTTPADVSIDITQAEIDEIDSRTAQFGSEIVDLRPLTPLQEGMLYRRLASPDRRDPYTNQLRLEMSGLLDENRLRRAAAMLQRRHTALRSGFVRTSRGTPVQVVHSKIPVAWTTFDATRSSDREIESMLFDERWEPYDLAHPPLMRFAVVRYDDNRWTLVLSNHHINRDGWSVPVILGDLISLYAGDPLDEPAEFGDYLDWLARTDKDAARKAWRAALAGIDEPSSIARQRGELDESTAVPESSNRHTFTVEWVDRPGAGLDATARSLGVTPNTVVQAAWAVLIARVLGRNDVVTGMTVSGRPEELPELAHAVGPFITTVPLRVQLRPNETVGDLCGRLHVEQADLLDHHHVGLAVINADVGLGELFDTGMVFENYPIDESLLQERAARAGWECAAVEAADATHFTLAIEATPTALGLRVNLEHRPDIVDDSEAARLAAGFARLLQTIVADPTELVGRLGIFGPDDTAEIVDTGVGPSSPNGEALLLFPDLFTRRVQSDPQALAVAFAESTLTFEELDGAAGALARSLVAIGAGPERVVAVQLPRSLELAVAMLAVIKAGAIYLPLDPDYPPERLQYCHVDAAPIVVIGGPSNAPAVTIDIDLDQLLENGVPGYQTPVAPDQGAYIVYTSGSTGRPKGVVVGHRGIPHLASGQIAAFEVSRDSRVLQFASPSFDAAFSEFCMAWLAGACLVLSTREQLLPGVPLADVLAEQRITHVTLPPAALPEMPDDALEGVRCLVVAGEQCPPEQVARFAGQLRMINAFGPTETTVCATMSRPLDDGGATPPMGDAIVGSAVYVLDSHLHPVPVGTPGELYVAGPSLARGYLGRAALTAERFVPNPHAVQSRLPVGSRMYRTGDVARRDLDGELRFLGRSDGQVKLRGFRIEPGEIETRLREHTGVHNAAVVVREDHPGDRRLVAYVVLRNGAKVAPVDLLKTLSEQLPAHLIPAAVVTLPELPLTPSGKIDRIHLPAPEWSNPTTRRLPKNSVEIGLCAIFAEVLGLETVGVEESFFDLGGHSLVAARLVGRLRAEYDAVVSMRDLFNYPTPEGLAQRLVPGTENSSPWTGITDSPRPHRIPLSAAQSRLWFLHRLEGASATYNIPVALRLTGRLDIDSLTAALGDVMDRHEALRTTVGNDEEGAYQCIRTEVEIVPEFVTATESTLRPMLRDAAGTAIDIENELPLRVTVFDLGDEAYVLLIVLHHIAGDGASTGPLAADLVAAYSSRSETGSAPLWAPLGVQYADYTLWQQRYFGAEVDANSRIASQLAFWRATLAGLPDELELPLDRRRPARSERGHAGESIGFAVPADVHRRIENIAAQHSASPFMVVHAALSVLLHRVGAGTDIPIGTPSEGRDHPELDKVVGFFVNTLVLRADLSGNPTFAQLLERVRTSDLAAYEHADTPFERLVEEINPQRNPGRHPLFQTMLVWDADDSRTAMDALAELPSLTVTVEPIELETAKFDLAWHLTPSPDGTGIRGRLSFATALRDHESAKLLVERLVRLLDQLTELPDEPIAAAQLASAEEQQRAIVDWSGLTVTESQTTDTVLDRFAASVDAAPSHIAVTDDSHALSYDELDSRSSQLARYLRMEGAGPERLVAIALPRSVDMAVVMLAVLKAGAAYLPIDPKYPSERIAFMLEDAAPVLLVTTCALLEDLTSASATQRLPNVLLLDDPAVAEGWLRLSAEPLSTRPALQNPMYVIYTSGSTGRPKGVVVEHRNVVRLVDNTAQWFEFGEDDVWTSFHSYAFDFSVWEIWGALTTGGRVVVVPELTAREPKAFRELIARERVTVLNQTPTAFYHLIQADAEAAALPDAEPLRLRWVIFGGEALDAGQLVPWYERYSSDAPRLVNMYGITETTVHVTYEPLDDGTVPNAGGSGIGRPIPDLGVYVLDDMLRPVPPGVLGEMYVTGAGVARGYLDRPGLTAGRFVPNPFASHEGGSPTGARMYRTGDLARFGADGHLVYRGRSDDQIKLRGFRIELGEVRAALAQQPGIAQAAAVIREDRDGDARLVGYVVPTRKGVVVDQAVLRAELARSLPEHMVPATIVTLSRLPLTANGKLDVKTLPAPDSSGNVTGRAPRSPQEELLCAAFETVLGVSDVGIDDSFFDLGGHSMLATRLTAIVRTALGTELSLRSLFEAPTVAKLVERLRDTDVGVKRPELVAGELGTSSPLSPSQRRLWLLHRLEGPGSGYNIPVALRVTGPLDVAALSAAFDDVVERQDVLRSVIDSDPASDTEGDARQRLHDAPSLYLGDPVEPTDIEQLIDEAAAYRFRLDAEPPIRAALHRVNTEPDAPDRHVLVIVAHHIAADGWSIRLLADEIAVAYTARERAQTPVFGELPIRYADFAKWQLRLLGDVDEPSSVATEQLDFWTRTLADLPAELQLPTDRPRPSVSTRRGSRHRVGLPTDLWHRMRTLAADRLCTPFMVFQGAVATLLHRMGAGTDIPLGTPHAGRGHAATHGLIGFFVDTVVLRTDLSGDPTFSEVLDRARRCDLDAFDNADVPFDRLVEQLRPERSAARHPLFQIAVSVETDSAQITPPVLGGLEVEVLAVDTDTAKFDLWILCSPADTEGRMCITIEYSHDLFDASTVVELGQRLIQLLDTVTAEPDVPVSVVDVRLPVERGRSVVPQHLNGADSIVEAFATCVAESPTAPALCWAGGVLDYGELDRRSNRFAQRLVAVGAGPGSVVPLLVERSPDMVVAMLAVLKVGAAYLPISNHYPDQQIRDVLEEVDAELLLTDAECTSRVADLGADLPIVDIDHAGYTNYPNREPKVHIRSDALAYVMYTSGSTGRPKGVAVSHGDVAALATDRMWRGKVDRVLLHSAHAWDGSTFELWAPLLTGGCVVVAPVADLDIEQLSGLIRKHEVTGLFLTTGVLNVMATEHAEVFAPLDLLIAGGDVLAAAAVAAVAEKCPATTMVNGYGPTETTVFATVHTAAGPDVEESSNRDSVPIGRPLDSMTTHVLDERLNPMADGVIGELYVGGRGIARCYWGRPDLTAERFVPDPYSTKGARLYRTGDLVRRRRTGTLEYVGRADDQVKIRGFRIEPTEIAAALEAIPMIKQCAVVVREDRPSDKQIVAYIVSSEQADPDLPRQVVDMLAEHLPQYMVPSHVLVLPRLPLTSIGKLDRRSLPAPLRADTGPRIDPRTAAEATLSDLYAEVLGLPSVGLDAGFFDLGGDSIMAIQLVSRARKAGLEISAADVFTAPTVAALATVSDSRAPATAEGETPGEGIGSVPAWPIVGWLAERGGSLDTFNQSTVLAVPPGLGEERLRRAVQTVLDTHDALRLRVEVRGRDAADWRLTVEPIGFVAAADRLRRIDCRSSEPSSSVPELHDELTAAGTSALDRLNIATGRMIEFVWLDAGDRPGLLLVVANHFVVDGVSWRILITDLLEAWESGDSGTNEPQPVFTSVRRWSSGLKRAAEEARDELPYWRRIANGIDPQFFDNRLDPDRDLVRDAGSVRLQLPVDVTESLITSVPGAVNAGVEEVLLASFAVAVAQWRRRRGAVTGAVTVDLESHGRHPEGPDLSRTVGWFTSLYPLALKLSRSGIDAVPVAGADTGRAIKEVKEQLRAVPRRGAGYGLLRYLDERGRAALGGVPAPHFGFNYLGRFTAPAVSEWQIAEGRSGPAPAAPNTPLAHVVELNAAVNHTALGHQLSVTWTWASRLVDETAVRELAADWFAAIEGIVNYAENGAYVGLTPSDVSLVDLSQDEIEDFEDLFRTDWLESE
ncbi:non-ribosomal peptide synthase/polyketide synthase [Rhodococcus sp. IEGM 1381]|uniref:non-ribosomal peptide synthase/polyketide synthase n=1 Tax=Rhodococcus sp. IEGM 1381 TaxID=3047085 RepID=UPI0024B6E884|nr:non-ribosomal peptide synthase/polyketide synthase [Rhodococcus sp. IEGM 1381]MDI9894478.1 non-ribosomal peptide synthase/polyketide synthase [Rhodococcus sp. IEGM 1381]